MIYKFDWVNNGLEITNPEIIINSYGNNLKTPNVIYADITLIVKKDNKIVTKVVIHLDNIQVNDRNFNEIQLMERVLTRLNDFKI